MSTSNKIVNYDTFCYRRELKIMEKEITAREEEEVARRRNSINRLLERAKSLNWDNDDE